MFLKLLHSHLSQRTVPELFLAMGEGTSSCPIPVQWMRIAKVSVVHHRQEQSTYHYY